jgi:hypothetical protein
MKTVLTEVPEQKQEVQKGWACPVCGAINAPVQPVCMNKCVSTEENQSKDKRSVLLG